MRARSWIKDRVSARVDELIPQGENVGGQTAIESVVPLIEDEMDEAAKWVLSEGDIDFLLEAVESDKKHFHATPNGETVVDQDTRVIIDSSTKVAKVPVPDNFLRFVSIKLSGFKRPVTELIGIRDAKYRFQNGNKYTAGSYDKPVGALIPFNTYISGEQTKWTLSSSPIVTNQTLSALINGYTHPVDDPDTLATGDIISLTGQTDKDENGIYLVNASSAPTKLSNDTTLRNKRMAIELFKAKTDSDTLEEFFYIPELLPEQMPDNTLPALIDYCAYRVMNNMGGSMTNEAKIAYESAITYINTRKRGLLNDGG